MTTTNPTTNAPARQDVGHTPGPWEAVGFGVYANWTDETDASRVSEIIFGNHNTRGASNEERRANARLIAAAPELLAALVAVLAALDWSTTEERYSLDAAKETARAALEEAGIA